MMLYVLCFFTHIIQLLHCERFCGRKVDANGGCSLITLTILIAIQTSTGTEESNKKGVMQSHAPVRLLSASKITSQTDKSRRFHSLLIFQADEVHPQHLGASCDPRDGMSARFLRALQTEKFHIGFIRLVT